MPAENVYDFVVLGGGSAGYAGARTAAGLGLRVAVVDGAEELGGLCILRGCMPSKAIIESANRARTIRRASEFGLRAGAPEVLGREIIERKRGLIGEFAKYRQDQLHSGNFDLIRGNGRFLSNREIQVDLMDGGQTTLEAQTTLVATGSTIFTPPIPGLESSGYLTSDEILELEDLPKSIIILGGGAIALEMAHYLGALGTEVTLIQRSEHTLSDLDPEIPDVVEQAYRERGMTVCCGTQVESIAVTASGQKEVRFQHEGQTKLATTEAILMAVGRKPALDGLDLEKAGVRASRGIEVEATQQSVSSPGIFGAGDVASPLDVVHIAIEQGELAAHNAAVFLRKHPGPMKEMDYRLQLFGVFSEPQVAVVGATERELKEQGRAYVTASARFDDHGKSMVMGETHGFVKLLADAETRELIGGAVVGPEAVDLIHEIVVAMHFRATAGDLARIPHYHPTLSEIWTYPAEELAES